jgi:hypothetical protein
MSKPLVLTEAEIAKFRALLDSDPNTFKEITGKGLAGRPKGSSSKLKTGSVIERVEDIPEQIPITLKEAEKLTKQKRAPRQMSEETKQKMALILAQGREIRKQKMEAEKEMKQAEKERVKAELKAEEDKKKREELAVQGKYIKRYVVDDEKAKDIKKRRPRTARKKNFVKEDSDMSEEESFTTESEMSEATIIRKIEKKKHIIDTIEKQLAKPETSRFDPFKRR